MIPKITLEVCEDLAQDAAVHAWLTQVNQQIEEALPSPEVVEAFRHDLTVYGIGQLYIAHLGCTGKPQGKTSQ